MAALLVGALAVALLGSGLFAVVTDSVTINDAVAVTDDFAEPELDLVIGPITGGEDAVDPCIADGPGEVGVNYTASDTIGGQSTGTLELARFYAAPFISPSPVSLGQYCIQNVSDTAGAVQMQLLSWTSTESGDCGSAEAAAEALAGGPTSCTDGDQGELGDFGLVLAAIATDSVHFCKGEQGSLIQEFFGQDEVGTAKDYDGGLVLEPGEACHITLFAASTRDAAGPETWQQVLTDTMEIDMAINLVEVTP